MCPSTQPRPLQRSTAWTSCGPRDWSIVAKAPSMNIKTMSDTGLRQRLLALLNDHPSCQTVLRDWEWYLGRELTPSDFSAQGLADYQQALASVLTDEQLMTAQTILHAAWDVGHHAGLIPIAPE